MAYQIARYPMILSNFQHHAPIASLLKCDFSCSCAAVDKISTDVARRAVPLLQLSFLLFISI